MARRYSPQSRLSSEINVTPMADIMLVLLIIFMITTPLLQPDISVNLPKAKNPLDAREGPIVLSMNREGRIYFGKTPVTEQEMIEAVSEGLAAEAGRTIYLKADQALAYGKVIRVVNQCRHLGVQNIGLMAEHDP
jgi:biopolymer transport protein TolR